MSDKLITIDLLKKFGDTCKASFQEVPLTVSGDGKFIELQFNVSIITGFYLICLDIKGVGDNKKFLDSKIIYSVDNHAVINNGSIAIKDGSLVPGSSTSSLLDLALSDSVKTVHVLSSVTRGSVIYKALTGVYLPDIPNLPYSETHLTNIYTGDSEETIFSIKDAFGEDQEYKKGENFSSIYAAGKLANTFDFELAAESDGGKSQDFDINGSRIIQIPWREYKAGKGVSISKDYEISSTAVSSIATKNDLGVVKIGDGVSITEDGVISVDSSIKAATTEKLGGVMLGKEGEGILPLQLDGDGRAYVNEPEAHRFKVMPKPSLELSGALYQYIGETTSEFTKGYFYNCLVKGGSLSITAFQTIGNVDPVMLFMKYIQDKSWDGGGELNPAVFLQNGWILKFVTDKWQLTNGEYSYSFPEEDFAKMGLEYAIPEESVKQIECSFRISNPVPYWVQKDVQPIGYLDNEDLAFMTDEDVDEIFAEKVEEIKVYNSSTEEEITGDFETKESEIYLSVTPELVAYSSAGKVTISKEESEYKVTITGNGSILFQSVIYPDITKTINIIKNEETV